jgi:hypothetical protein
MCDYSLCGIPNRLAVEGEELVVHKFQTGSMGLASPTNLPVATLRKSTAKKSFWQNFKNFFEIVPPPVTVAAVCIPPGAHLILKDIPDELQRQCGVSGEEGVIFTQLNAEVHCYRDAVRFGNGCHIILQDLRQGMRVEILSLAGVTEYFPVMEEAIR